MNPGDTLAILLFVSMIMVLGTGIPVAFSLAGLSLAFALIGHFLDAFNYTTLINLPLRYLGTMTNETLVAVPLFILMGNILQKSGIAEELLTSLGKLFGTRPGGLGFSVILVGAVLAAATGVVGATVATMALIALPAMLRAGYSPGLATGVIGASSTLAQIVPPSTVLIFTADILSGVNQAAQMRIGNFAPTTLSTGDLFAGAMLPGLMLVCFYIMYMLAMSLVRPASCPPISFKNVDRRTLYKEVIIAAFPPLLLIIAVLGSILVGIATPTESASVGALGSTFLAFVRGRLNLATLREAGQNTAITTAMIFAIVISASLFSLVFRGLGGEHMVEQALGAMPGGLTGAVLVVMFAIFLLGFFLDTFEIIMIMLPICGGPLIIMGADPIWLGVLVALNLQTSFITPPFGFALFYLRSFTPATVSTGTIWKGAIPFVMIQILGLLLLWVFPELATWLPNYLFS